MKKVLYIFSIILLFASCAQLEIERPADDGQIVDGMLKVDFSVNYPALSYATKSFTTDPDIRKMKVVVFDNHGVYISQSDATLTNESTSGGIMTGEYSAYFPVDEIGETRIIHFIANYDGDIPFGTELESISKLTVEGDIDCFWQRIEVPDLTVEYLRDAEGDGGRFVLSNQDTVDELDGIVLVRNFCALQVSTTDTRFQISSAGIFNVPTEGTIAPYSSDNSSFVGANGFVTNYQGYTSIKDLIDDGYKASTPLNITLKGYSDSDMKGAEDGKIDLFSYEREVPLSDPPFLLVKGKYDVGNDGSWDNDSETWYRINLQDSDDNYYPLLRNFQYKINIRNVNHAGFSTAQQAIQSVGSGDVFADIRTSDLPELSNGEAGMRVSATEIVFIDESPQDLRYIFVPLNGSYVKNGPADDAWVNTLNHENEYSVQITLGEPGLSGPVFNIDRDVVYPYTIPADNPSITIGEDGDDDWRTVTLTPNEPGDAPKTQSITITGTYRLSADGQDHKISRTINCILREKPSFTIACVDGSGNETHQVAGTKGTDVRVRIGIPTGLTSSLFPLSLNIEARNRTLSPANGLPVVTGESFFDSSVPGFHYVQTVQWSDYINPANTSDGHKYIDCNFKTNIAQSSTDIVVTNPKFKSAVTYFTNGESKTYSFRPITVEQKSSTQAVLSFYMQTVTPVTISISNATIPTGGKNQGKTISGSAGTYSYTPAATGLQELVVNLAQNQACTIQLSGSGYEAAKAGHISSYGYYYSKSERTVNAQIPGNSTTLEIPASCVEFESGANVSFIINGSNYSAGKSGEYYTCTYNIAPNQEPGSIKVSAKATKGDITAYADLGAIEVWKQVVTVGSTAITNATDLNNQNVNWNNPTGKKIWKGVVLQNNPLTTRYLKWNGSLSTEDNPTDIDSNKNLWFQSNGSTYLKTFDGKYLRISSSSAYDLNNTSSTITVKYDNGWQFCFSDDRYHIRLNSTGVVSVSNGTRYQWTAYPVTVEYVAP